MIKSYSDHAANERTFLAWVRTAITVMAFGFLVEKFDLFLKIAAASMTSRTLRLPSSRYASEAGLALIVVGLAMIGIATLRFLQTAKEIDSPEVRLGPGSRLDVVLAVMLFLLGCALLAYMANNMMTGL
ncbi:MAG TPA: DUF202 domain-containing protein [Caulobacteraceae bacterium]